MRITDWIDANTNVIGPVSLHSSISVIANVVAK